MSLNPIFKKRYSCRNYEDKEISQEKLENVLNAGRLAPSARNKQPYKFVVVEDEDLKKELAKAAGQDFIGKASVIIAGVSLDPENKMSCSVPTYPVDLAIALDHITLQAVEEGLATCWIGAFDQKKAKEILSIPKDYKIASLMPLGYPADNPPAEKQRKDLDKLVCYDQFEE